MNTIVFAARGLPAGFLGAYGNEWVATPNLDRLAAESVVFDNHLSDAPEATAAGRAWRSGVRQLPGVATAGSQIDLVRTLNRYGVRTVLVRHARPESPADDAFAADWSRVIDAPPDASDRSPIDSLLRAVQALAADFADGPPWLLWIDIDRFLTPWDAPRDVFEAYIEGLFDDEEPQESDAEAPGLPPPADAVVEPWLDPPAGWFDTDDMPSWELLHRSFAAAVTTFDADFGRLWKIVESCDWLGSTHVIVTADRGTPLGEHGVIGLHRPWMYSELIHLPLTVRLAGAEQAGRRVAALTQPPDLMPTLLDAFGVTLANGTDGHSLFPACRGEPFSDRAAVGGLELDGRREWYLRTADWHLVAPAVTDPDGDDDPRPVALFAKPDDRWEQNDAARIYPDLTDELLTRLGDAVPTSPGFPASR